MVELYFIAEKFWLIKNMLFKKCNLFDKQPLDKHCFFFLPQNSIFYKEIRNVKQMSSELLYQLNNLEATIKNCGYLFE